MKQWYEELFIDYADTYDKEAFTQGTVGEVEFIEQEVKGDKSVKILDVGCGTGRHAVELAKRGYTVTGIDLSESQLAKAKEKAAAAKVNVTFLKHDARTVFRKGEFDLVIMLCEGGFSLMETDEMNYKILENASLALKEHGKFIFSALNALFPLCHNLESFLNENAVEGRISNTTFDLLTLREISTLTIKDDKGKERTLHCNERFYMPSEISWYLKTLGFHTIDILGCPLGKFSRGVPLTKEDFELLAVAER